MQPVFAPLKGQIIPIRVVPKAGRDAVEGWVEDAKGEKWLKLRVSAVPEDGKANKAVLALLAKYWGVAPSRLCLVSGETGRRKRVRVD
jgi:uncharacterized protein (TIGR00251 family)